MFHIEKSFKQKLYIMSSAFSNTSRIVFLNVSSNILVVTFRVNIFEEVSSPRLLTKWFLKILFRHLLF
jgi:hypothetical protein